MTNTVSYMGWEEYINSSYSTLTTTIQLDLFYQNQYTPPIKHVYNSLPIPILSPYKNKKQKNPIKFRGHWFKLGKKK